MAAFLLKCMEEPAYGSPPTPPPIYRIHDIGEAWKKFLRFQQHWLASYNSYKILAIRLLYLYSESGVHALRHQVVIAS